MIRPLPAAVVFSLGRHHDGDRSGLVGLPEIEDGEHERSVAAIVAARNARVLRQPR